LDLWIWPELNWIPDRIHSLVTIPSKLDGIAQNHSAAPPTVSSPTPLSPLLALTLSTATSSSPAFHLRALSPPPRRHHPPINARIAQDQGLCEVRVRSEFETATRDTRNCGTAVEQGGFVLCQMSSDMWYVELAADGNKVRAGCNGRLVWHHMPWLNAHTTKGPIRPLCRCSRTAASSRRTTARCPISCYSGIGVVPGWSISWSTSLAREVQRRRGAAGYGGRGQGQPRDCL
jgi:hypothetical protein